MFLSDSDKKRIALWQYYAGIVCTGVGFKAGRYGSPNNPSPTDDGERLHAEGFAAWAGAFADAMVKETEKRFAILDAED